MPPYTIRRRVNDTHWEYLREGYGKKRFWTREKAKAHLDTLDKNLNWKVSCCGS